MVKWRYSETLVDYEDAIATMEREVALIAEGAKEVIWSLEHPPLYTAGTSAQKEDLVSPDRFPVYKAGRGGQYTYHGPGQRVVYVMLDLNRRGRDIRKFVSQLENWVISTLAEFNIHGEVRDGRVGVWVPRPEKGRDMNGEILEEKIAAVGIRLKKWVSYHGISININPDLEHFSGIVPCGIRAHGVTSFMDLGQMITMEEFDMALRARFELSFD